MNNMKQDNKRNYRFKNAFLNLIALVVFAVSVLLIYQVAQEVIETVKLQDNLKSVNQQLKVLEEENAFLTTQSEKLQDPEYVKNYARFGYMLSKEGEQIFFLPEKSDDE